MSWSTTSPIGIGGRIVDVVGAGVGVGVGVDVACSALAARCSSMRLASSRWPICTAIWPMNRASCTRFSMA